MLLRHDVDISLELALELAELEHLNGFRATYFVLLDTEFYNALSSGNRQRIIDIHRMGHEVGLHFDASKFTEQAALETRVGEECGILEDIVGSPITIVAPHRPTPEFLGRSGRICGRIHPYSPKFFTDIQYVSDSLGGWTRDHPIENEAFAIGANLQILTHPYIWTTPQSDNQREKLKHALAVLHKRLDQEAGHNFKNYRRCQSDGQDNGGTC